MTKNTMFRLFFLVQINFLSKKGGVFSVYKIVGLTLLVSWINTLIVLQKVSLDCTLISIKLEDPSVKL